MPGWLSNGLPEINISTGSELFNVDTETANGVAPQSVSVSIQRLAQMMNFYGNVLDKTMVSGSRYYASFNVAYGNVFTGVSVHVGSTGGTDNWIVELHGPTGLLLATSNTSGVTAGTANTWQQIPFTATYTATTTGVYFLALQSNGTTAKFASLNAPTSPKLTGSATGIFGTGASITPPTTYTANLGPDALLY